MSSRRIAASNTDGSRHDGAKKSEISVASNQCGDQRKPQGMQQDFS